MEFECCCSFVKEYNIEVESTIRPILYPSRPIKLQRFCLAIMLNILFILYNFQKTLKTIKRYKCNLEHYRLSCILLRSIWESVTSLWTITAITAVSLVLIYEAVALRCSVKGCSWKFRESHNSVSGSLF